MSTFVRLTAPLAIVALTACASAPAQKSASSSSAAQTAAQSRNPNLLTAADIAARGQVDGTAYDVIRRLRPTFLTFHGAAGTSNAAGAVQVSLDGSSLSAVSLLQGLPALNIAEVRYLSASDAAQRFGTSANGGPVLLVKQK